MRPVRASVENVMFESSADGSLRVRNSTGLVRIRPLTERLQHWQQLPLIACFSHRVRRALRKVTYLEALNPLAHRAGAAPI